MTKVNINGHSHQVEVEHDGDLAEAIVLAEALEPHRTARTWPGRARVRLLRRAAR